MTRSGQWVWSARSAGLVFLLALIVLTLPVWLWYVKQERQLETVQTGGIVMHARTGNDYLQVFTQGKWRDLLIKGVNMGIAKPGYFPGETAITKAEYFRWFRQIGAMNANTVRVYTLHPPAFYEALYEYNETAPQPLYLLQGVWVNEEEFVQAGDAFADAVTSDFRNEIGRIVDAVHGKATVPQRAGHASGTYSRDISPYLLGWVIGIEWDGQAVHSTNVKHAGMSDFTGSFFRTKQAEPFEIWLAQMLDFTAGYESSAYGWQRPMSFTNWVTTDLLKHPSEPSEREDMASVDPNAIEPMESFHAGYFASYHVYPYYPDFMNYEPRYTEYVDRRGQKNNYAGYLHDMKQAHPMPMLVAEFGVPASR
ncbi:MAG: hypothetical protein K0Q59_2693, partial [Paenibacillus sp.]|nr:hypothetical protein [Paenibacillus sp.]